MCVVGLGFGEEERERARRAVVSEEAENWVRTLPGRRSNVTGKGNIKPRRGQLGNA